MLEQNGAAQYAKHRNWCAAPTDQNLMLKMIGKSSYFSLPCSTESFSKKYFNLISKTYVPSQLAEQIYREGATI
ncbi:MAG: hypothetical protein DYH15_04175 [Nitrosomonas sp. PRO4]|nr:hypothetical protein [Nitrosomonas sp. PRO4]